MNDLISRGVLNIKKSSSKISQYLEFKLLHNRPNNLSESDHKEFELKCTREGYLITLGNCKRDLSTSSFFNTKVFKKCRNMVYITWGIIDGKKVFTNFYHFTETMWYEFVEDLKTDWTAIHTFSMDIGIENFETMASYNFVPTTKYLQLFKEKDYFSETKQCIKKRHLRLRIKRSLITGLIGLYLINNPIKD